MDFKFVAGGYEPPEWWKKSMKETVKKITSRVGDIDVRFTLGPKYKQAKAANDALIIHMLQEGAKKESKEDMES